MAGEGVPRAPAPHDEAELVRRAQCGDMHAFAELVRAHQRVAQRVAWVLAAADGEDAVQEAFLKAWKGLPRFREESPFRPWLLRIVANEAHNRRRSRGRAQAHDARAAALVPATAASVEELAVGGDDRRALVEALACLPERDRTVLVLRFLCDLSEHETAAALRCARGTVKSRTSRALARLRMHLDATGAAQEVGP